MKSKKKYADIWMGYTLPSNANYFNSNKHWSKNKSTMEMHYKEITNDQFFDHVFNKMFTSDMPAPEPKGYCIKRTPENAEVLNKWAKTVGENLQENNGYIYSENIYDNKMGFGSNYWSEDLIEGFTELHTVEEFFEKVNYKPELEMSNFEKAINSVAEPVLIAKAGDWVKIVDFGVSQPFDNWHLNTPYELLKDLTEENGFYVVKDSGGCSGNGWNHAFKNGMKFERCSPLLEEVKEETGTINIQINQDVLDHLMSEEKPIDKVTIDVLDSVLRMCNIQLSRNLIDKIIDAVELIEDKKGNVNIGDVLEMKKGWGNKTN